MARKDALLRLHRRLMEQREELKKKLASQMELVGEQCGPGDIADQSQIDIEQDLGSQLASLESRELQRIEKALAALKAGTYGTCEYCEVSIPIARLQALPHTTNCVKCQRLHEVQVKSENSLDRWESAWEHQARQNDMELTVNDVKIV